MGMVIVFLPANFPHDPHPAWAFYDALPDPLGWLLVLAGLRGLRVHLDVDVARWLAWAAFVRSGSLPVMTSLKMNDSPMRTIT